MERTLDELAADVKRLLRPNDADPRAALRAVMRGVADLWSQHHDALMVAARLAGSVPSVFERMRAVIDGSMPDMATLLRRIGGNTLTRDIESAQRLAAHLGWMTERNFYVLGRERPSPDQLYALADELSEIWLEAAGHRG